MLTVSPRHALSLAAILIVIAATSSSRLHAQDLAAPSDVAAIPQDAKKTASGLASKILKAMQSLVRAEYVNDFDKMVRGYAKLLDELDLLASKKATLDKTRRRLEDRPNAAKAKTLDREEEAYDEAMEDLAEREEKLLELRRKDAS